MVIATILLIEDREIIVENIKKCFSDIGVKLPLFLAINENEAWFMLTGSNKLNPIPKIILIDVNRTTMEGMKLLNSIRNHPDLKSILVFAITDSDQEINKASALNFNIAGYIPMSFESNKLNHFFSILNDYWNSIEF